MEEAIVGCGRWLLGRAAQRQADGLLLLGRHLVEPADFLKDLPLALGVWLAVELAQLVADVLVHLEGGLVRLFNVLDDRSILVGRRLIARVLAVLVRVGLGLTENGKRTRQQREDDTRR